MFHLFTRPRTPARLAGACVGVLLTMGSLAGRSPFDETLPAAGSTIVWQRAAPYEGSREVLGLFDEAMIHSPDSGLSTRSEIFAGSDGHMYAAPFTGPQSDSRWARTFHDIGTYESEGAAALQQQLRAAGPVTGRVRVRYKLAGARLTRSTVRISTGSGSSQDFLSLVNVPGPTSGVPPLIPHTP